MWSVELKYGGKLASDNHGITEFAKQRKAKIIAEQLARESGVRMEDIGWVRYVERK